MTNISSMKTYIYCPRKVYIQENIIQEKATIDPMYSELKLLHIDIENLLNKNMRRLKREMDLREVEQVLLENVQSTINNTFDDMTNSAMELYDDFNREIFYNIRLLSMKAKKTMDLMEKDGSAICEMYFPSSMNSYFLKDEKLDLSGMCDRIEIVDGCYYPISYKNSTPPLKGVWNQDAMELAAQAILIEHEFDCDVYVGFVEYRKLGERRPVVMDVNIRKGVFDILHEMSQMRVLKKAPVVKINEKKCDLCEYRDICLEKNI